MRSLRSIAAASLVAICLAAPAFAQSYSYMTPDHFMRMSKVIGLPVYNENNEKIGVIDDIILPAKGGEAMAVLSVGDFVGGTKMVKVPLGHVHLAGDKPMMPATKAAITAMPNYNYGFPG